MNKDVIYIEPQDDITDIITKIEGSKEKIVALVPPKKAGVFRSIVNIKLISKAGKTAGKTVVIVTVDPSIVKLAAATKLPVTKNLQSAPSIPEMDGEAIIETTSTEKLDNDAEDVAEEDSADNTEDAADTSAEENSAKTEVEVDVEDGAVEDSEVTTDDKSADEIIEEAKKSSKKPKGKLIDDDDEPTGGLANSKNKFLRWIGTHKKMSIALGVGGVGLIIFAVWALVIAPAVTLTVALRTTTGNFSENINFTEKLNEENISEGKFYIEERKYESKSEISFEATGRKNVGEKASGTVVVYAYFKGEGTLPIPSGTVFTNGDKKYVSTAAATLAWDGDSFSVCDNKNASASEIMNSGCQKSARINVTAEASGSSYNIAPTSSGWTSNLNTVGIYSDAAMSGGTDETITVVQQSDIDQAKEKMSGVDESANKEKLMSSLKDDDFAIESSFKQTTSDAVSSPAVGEEVKSGEKAKLTVTTTDTIFVMDATKLKEFIRETAKLPENYTIYDMNDPFIENFMKTDSGYTGKLKTSYVSGPKITENDVIDLVKGKGLGVAQHDLNSTYEGIKSVTIDTSVPWVMSIPDNPERITVIIKKEE